MASTRNKDEAAEVPEAVPGKPASQVEAEAPPDAETAAQQEAELESRMPSEAYLLGEQPAAEEPEPEEKPARGREEQAARGREEQAARSGRRDEES